MASSYGSLAKEAVVLLDKFSAGRQCLDDFMEDASKDLQNMDTLHQKFILDVVSGCIEYRKLLDVVIDVFYGQNRKCLSRADRSQFVIICYLTTFSLDDLGLECFSNIIKSLDIKKMHTFLTFFFTNLTTWIQEEWNKIYDAAYVEEHWIGRLLRWRSEMDILMDQLAVKISRGSQVKKAPIKTTEPQEFSLTKPKPRPLPMPQLIPQLEKSKPVPISTYMTPKEMKMIEDIKQKNHQKTEELLYEANMKQFRCVNPQKSEHTKRVMSEIKKDLDSKLKFNSFQSSGRPSSNKTNSWPIKLNNAAILRQGALYDRQVEEELQRMERLVEGARDPSSFLQWQKEMREKDLQDELAKIERRRLEGRISYEEAAMARSRIMERNQKTAQLKKEETAHAGKRLQREKERQAAVIRKEERKARQGFRQEMTQSETVLALQKKLEEKQQERQRLKQIESKAKPCEQAANKGTHNKKSLTEKSWEELELSLERNIQKVAPYAVSQTETLKT
ncbi:cilia- and flagella-associated protein 99 isoform X2 [Centropristis striata]|nr:cilia- and flagella-associated protein 99 isoform X2 [Centropristis striata]